MQEVCQVLDKNSALTHFKEALIQLDCRTTDHYYLQKRKVGEKMELKILVSGMKKQRGRYKKNSECLDRSLSRKGRVSKSQIKTILIAFFD